MRAELIGNTPICQEICWHIHRLRIPVIAYAEPALYLAKSMRASLFHRLARYNEARQHFPLCSRNQ
jgi:hypothetical protein